MDNSRESAIAQALVDKASGKYGSLRAAAAAHDIPQKTLVNRAHGHTSRLQSHAHQMLLSPSHEKRLVEFLLQAEQGGSCLTHAQIRDIVTFISRCSGTRDTVGVNWVPRFLKRHPEIQLKPAGTSSRKKDSSCWCNWCEI